MYSECAWSGFLRKHLDPHKEIWHCYSPNYVFSDSGRVRAFMFQCLCCKVLVL